MDLLLKVEVDEEKTMHRTVVLLFTDVPGTVRVDCTVPEPDIKTEVISPIIDLNNDRVRCQSINFPCDNNTSTSTTELAQTLTLDPL